MARPDAGRRAAQGGRERAGWRPVRAAVFVALVSAGMMLASAAASAADTDAPSGQHAVDPKDRVSPYARIAQEHQQKLVRPAKGRPVTFSKGRSTRTGGHTRR